MTHILQHILLILKQLGVGGKIITMSLFGLISLDEVLHAGEAIIFVVQFVKKCLNLIVQIGILTANIFLALFNDRLLARHLVDQSVHLLVFLSLLEIYQVFIILDKVALEVGLFEGHAICEVFE